MTPEQEEKYEKLCARIAAREIEKVRTGTARVVRSKKRCRVLFKRREFIWWSSHLNAWLWEPKEVITK